MNQIFQAFPLTRVGAHDPPDRCPVGMPIRPRDSHPPPLAKLPEDLRRIELLVIQPVGVDHPGPQVPKESRHGAFTRPYAAGKTDDRLAGLHDPPFPSISDAVTPGRDASKRLASCPRGFMSHLPPGFAYSRPR